MKRNLIYTSLFIKEEYNDLTELLLKSIHMFSNINRNTTDIVIYTSSKFAQELCKRVGHLNLPIYFHTFDDGELRCIFQLCCLRLQIFKNGFAHNYGKILYLDTDVLINSDINALFDLELDDDKLYALEEGKIDFFFWGDNFFDFENIDKNTTAFSSGVMLFKNTPQIIELFENINDHIWYTLNTDQSRILFYDQPFIVYNAISRGKYNNQLLKGLVENNPGEVSLKTIVCHFPGTVGDVESKANKMKTYMEKSIIAHGMSLPIADDEKKVDEEEIREPESTI